MNEEIIQWAIKVLTSLGYVLKSNHLIDVQITPWSYVGFFETNQGHIYLKYTPELIALEADIIKILSEEFQACVPDIISHGSELNCFLMKNSGSSLRKILKNNFDTELVCKAVDQFTSLQIAIADRTDVLVNIGVPDWGLNKFPDLFDQLLLQKDILIADGLTENEIKESKTLLPKISDLCQKLSNYPVKKTMVQPDFNDNNTLVDDNSQKLTIIDLGEIVISHPFFSLGNFLLQMKKHHGLTDTDDRYLQIRDACLKNFIQFDSKERLLEAFSLSQILGPVYWVLANYRMMLACGPEKVMQFQPGRLSATLKGLQTIC